MSRIEAVLDRLRALPEAEQDMIASEIEGLLAEPSSSLTLSQWAEVEAELDDDDRLLSHADVMARMRARFGR